MIPQKTEKEYILICNFNEDEREVREYLESLSLDVKEFVNWYKTNDFFFLMTPIGSLWDDERLMEKFAEFSNLYLLTETNGIGGKQDKHFWEWYKEYSGNLTNLIHNASRKMKINKLLDLSK